jgi:hypothetical protein
MYEAPSDVEALLLVFVTSKPSTIPVGGVIEPLALLPKKPTTSDPLTSVVREGAAIKRVLALKTPPFASKGMMESTFA